MITVLIAALLAGTPQQPSISFWSDRGSGRAQVYVMNADGTAQSRLTNLFSAKRAVWSPDARRLAFDGRFHVTLFDFDIGVMNADGSGVRRVTRGAARDVLAAWSPNGRWIAFMREYEEGGMPEVRLVRPDGSGNRRVIAGGSPAWSPDGRWLAFERPGGIWVIRPDGTGLRRLVAGEVGAPAWSPDRRRLAYTTWEYGAPEIEVARADGSGRRRVTRNRADDFGPAWSPDGRRLLYTHGPDGAHDVYVMDADGSHVRNLTPGAGDDWATAWRPR